MTKKRPAPRNADVALNRTAAKFVSELVSWHSLASPRIVLHYVLNSIQSHCQRRGID